MNPTDLVDLKIDGTPVSVPKGTLIIRAAETAGIHIPRFCDHPLLKPVGACRQCLVDVAAPDREGNVRPFPKPQAACTMTVMPGMEVSTQLTSETAAKSQRGVMEFLLLNHPLDCPVCDKGGECPLQNQAMLAGRDTARFADVKRTFPKPVSLSSNILLDRERCILCQRCIRFQKEIAGDPFIDLQGRGGGSSPREAHPHMGEQVGAFDTQILGFYDEDANPTGDALTAEAAFTGPGGFPGARGTSHPGPLAPEAQDASGRPFASYFSGNTIQICPVGALTSAGYRFRSRPFDLLSTPAVTEHDASGAAIRVDVRRGQVTRRLAGEDAEVNEEWISDKDRFAFTWQRADDRLQVPLVRDEDGNLVATSWGDALDIAARGLAAAREKGGVGFLPGGRLTYEDAYAWAKFARLALGTNDIDHRFRAASGEEAQFLAGQVAGQGLTVTYQQLERAGQVLLVSLEPEDECATLFLRLRKGVLAGGVQVTTIAAQTTLGSKKMRAQVIPAAPGTEPEIISAISAGSTPETAAVREALTTPGATILVGERAATVPGLLSTVTELAKATGAELAWVPRRVGERGGVEAGTLPGLLPGGRLVGDAEARADVQAVWGLAPPAQKGRDLAGILGAAKTGELGGLVVGGIDLRDLPHPEEAQQALENAGFVVALEVRASDATDLADVVLPVAPPAEKPGTYLNFEGRLRPFGQALASRAISDREVLNRLAAEMGVDLGLGTLRDVHAEANELLVWDGQRAQAPLQPAGRISVPGEGEAVLATHKTLLDDGLCQDGEIHLAASARRTVARLNPATAAAIGLAPEQQVRIGGPAGEISLPWAASDLPERVIWVPECAPDCQVHLDLGAHVGAVVTIAPESEVKQ